jgi:hypothetical protein
MIESQTFRFTFSKDFVEVLSRFAKVHQYDERKQFKEEWKKWTEDEDIRCFIQDEIKLLHHNGFVGDAMDKMFKSARYYFRKKSDQQKEKKERRNYTGFSKSLLTAMDEHILLIMKQHSKTIQNENDEMITMSTITPEDAYQLFCKEHVELIKEEIVVLKDKIDQVKVLSEKFKKTYKNRVYMLRTTASQ